MDENKLTDWIEALNNSAAKITEAAHSLAGYEADMKAGKADSEAIRRALQRSFRSAVWVHSQLLNRFNELFPMEDQT